MRKGFRMFITVLVTAFLIALTISTMIAIAEGAVALPLTELRNDLFLGLFIACVQLIWVGSDKSNKTYIVRTIIHFIVLITGCTLLMIWFGWLPPNEWIVSYYILFIAAYIIIWFVCWNVNRKKWRDMNRRLEEFKRKNQ